MSSAQGNVGIAKTARRRERFFGLLVACFAKMFWLRRGWAGIQVAMILPSEPHIAKQRKKGKEDGSPRTQKKAGNVEGCGETTNGINSKTGWGDGRCLRNSEYHFSPKCPRRGILSKNSAPVASYPRVSSSPADSSNYMGFPANAQDVGLSSQEDSEEPCEKTRPAASEPSGKQSSADADSASVLDTGATANSACVAWLDRHDHSHIRPKRD